MCRFHDTWKQSPMCFESEKCRLPDDHSFAFFLYTVYISRKEKSDADLFNIHDAILGRDP